MTEPEVGYYPVATFVLALLMMVTFILTVKNLTIFENQFGFIPAKPTVYSLLTYNFIHVSLIHLFLNMAFLLIAGFVVEQTLGKLNLTLIYFGSGLIAILFDILGRLISGISSSVPLVGSSGAIFGVMTIAALTKPLERVPTILVIYALIFTFLQLAQGYLFILPANYPILFLVASTFGIIMLSFIFIPPTVPIIFTLLLFLASNVLSIANNFNTDVSNLGHIGGILGGVIFYFLAKSTKINPDKRQFIS